MSANYLLNKPIVELSRRDANEYSIARAIRCLTEKTNGLEAEISAELRRSLAGGVVDHGGVYVLTHALKRSGLDRITVGGGKELVFSQAGPFVDALRASSVTMELGAQLLVGLRSDLELPRMKNGASAEWIVENGPGLVSENLTLSQIPLKMRTAACEVSFSRNLFIQSTPQVDDVITRDIARANAAAVDRAALYGNGEEEPLGIFNKPPGTNEIDFAGPIAFGKLTDMEFAIGDSSAETGRLGWITTPAVRRSARKLTKESSIPEPIWDDQNLMISYPARSTKHAAKTAGTEGIALGVWSEMYVGEFGLLELVYDPFTNKKQNMIELSSFYYVDLCFAHAESFAISKGLTLP